MEIKPQAMAIPKETDHLENGKYGPVYPKTPACYGFTVIAKIIPGARLIEFQETGHVFFTEKPDEVNQALIAFFGKDR